MKIVQHLMPVVRPHRQRNLPPLLHCQRFFYHRHHINIATQMIGFEKIPFGIPFGTAQMNEMNMISQPADHARQIII